jgi:hypothetical protein
MYFKAIRNFLWSFGIFYSNWVYFCVIWCIFPNLVCCTKKNLATLHDVPATGVCQMPKGYMEFNNMTVGRGEF